VTRQQTVLAFGPGGEEAVGLAECHERDAGATLHEPAWRIACVG
jgi:hypothetical protein